MSWKEYTRMLRAFAERPAYRLTYDCGELEIMSPSKPHDNNSRFFVFLIQVLTEELALPMSPGGSTTLRRVQAKRGLEPDECFWIANAAAVVGNDDLDLSVHPPPDLALEVDVHSSSLDRMSIYASIGVPEVWRLDSGALAFHALVSGQYQTVSHSLSFPQVTASDLWPFLQTAHQSPDKNAIVRQFRAWVRQHHGLANP